MAGEAGEAGDLSLTLGRVTRFSHNLIHVGAPADGFLFAHYAECHKQESPFRASEASTTGSDRGALTGEVEGDNALLTVSSHHRRLIDPKALCTLKADGQAPACGAILARVRLSNQSARQDHPIGVRLFERNPIRH
ncbi:hypothetical protein SKAU_G00192370 [Synaphobranchus kaupii]|uniref:Uncharacterized protein n=1 Tax=Synaphobranchus kaupii TaxID=118154 RepID=A0A9Q1FE95_SYNKA|nr:hypothetical protein SKAU_G00192370 [Synaphobranchus kaupii]